MYYSTSKKILETIKQSPGMGAKEIIQSLGSNDIGIFRHLKRLQEEDLVYKIGKAPKVRYYAFIPLKGSSPLLTKAAQWAVSGDERSVKPQQLCPTRDIFQARSDKLLLEFKKAKKNENLIYLIVAAVGEIGNNSFDHNLGQWLDTPGIFFDFDLSARVIVMADRGQGVYKTIKKVKPQVKDDREALTLAFTYSISGRAPERRGNGLKFVKKVMEENSLYFEFHTGQAIAEITKNGMNIQKSFFIIPGTLTIIHF